MRTNARKRNTRLFVAFLLLGVVFQSFTYYRLDLWRGIGFCANSLVYAGLIMFWLQSIRERLLPSRAKRYMIASALLMLLFIIVRQVKYRYLGEDAALKRLCWYLYYLPILLVPTLFMMSGLNLGGERRRRWDERWLLLPAGLLAALVLTNELHSLVFRPYVDLAVFDGTDGTYGYGVGYYAVVAWVCAMMIGGVANLIRASRKPQDWRRAIRPLLFLPLALALSTVQRLAEWHLFAQFKLPEILVFCMLGTLESCIRGRLIPHNENYVGFFAQLRFPAMIADLDLRPVYRTAMPVEADAGRLRAALDAPCYPDPDARLSGMAIRSGFAFYQEDESGLHRMNEALRDANELLALENEVIQREQDLIEEAAGIEARNRLYAKAALAVYPTQRKISELIAAARPDTPGFRADVARMLALTAFVKRKANFVMLSSERETVTAAELISALMESAHYLSYCGMRVEVSAATTRSFACREAEAAYDGFGAAVEALWGRADALLARLTDGALLILADGDAPLSLPPLSLPVRQTCEDGQLILKLALGGDRP